MDKITETPYNTVAVKLIPNKACVASFLRKKFIFEAVVRCAVKKMPCPLFIFVSVTFLCFPYVTLIFKTFPCLQLMQCVENIKTVSVRPLVMDC